MNHGFILIELLTALIILSYCLGAGFNYLFTSQAHSQQLYFEYIKYLDQANQEVIRLKALSTLRR